MPADPNRVKDLFLVATDRPADERAAFLDDACGADAELRAAVERLLAAHSTPDRRIDSPTADHRPADPPGLVLAGRYKLVEPIGEGGMGAVWMAQQVEPVKRAVAVKLIKAGMDSKAVLARFEAERQALALMDHPNIAKVHDAGLTPDGRPFFVLELVKGTPITEFCDARKLTPRERLELFVPVCQAVQHAHQKGIVHRDIKPSNVLVALYDDRPVPKVIDFGVAKAAGHQLTEQTLMTGFGAVVGTPEYMSPEQASFNQLDVDTRSDVYSLGVLLYELLTGGPPFSRKELEAKGVLEVLRVVREQEPPRPSARLSTSHTLASIAAVRGTEPARLTRLVRGELDWLVMKALEKDRTRRYETATGLAADVQRYLAGEPVQAVPPSAGYRLRKFARRHRAGVLTAAAFALLLVAGAAVSTWQAVRATLAERREADHRRTAEESERAALAAAEAADAERGRAVEAGQAATAARDRERFTAYAHRIALAHREYLANNVARARRLLADCPPDLRGWEWGYVRRLCHAELATFRGHRGGARAVAFSPDGTRVASAGSDGVRIWDPATGRELVAIPGEARAVAFRPDGRRLAVGGPKAVTIHDPADGREVLRIDANVPPPAAGLLPSGYPPGTEAVAFSPDGWRLATAGDTGRRGGEHGHSAGVVRVWDTATGKELPKFTATLPTRGTAVAFSPDGKHLAATAAGAPGDRAESGELHIWAAATGERRHTIRAYENPERLVGPYGHGLVAVAFSPDGRRVATGGTDGTAHLWDVPTGRPGPVLRGHERSVPGVAFAPAAGLLATAGADGTVRLWDAESGLERYALRGHTAAIFAVAFDPTGTRVASAGDVIRVWDATADPTARECLPHDPPPALNRIDEVAFRPDGRLLAVGTVEGVRFVDVPTGREYSPRAPIRPGGRGGLARVAFRPDGAAVATTGPGGVKLWDVGTGDLIRSFPDPPEIAAPKYAVTTDLAFRPDGRRLATVGGNRLMVWEADTGRLVHNLPSPRRGLALDRVVFAPDGKRVVTATRSRGGIVGEVRVWDAEAGTSLRAWDAHATDVAIDPTGTRVAAPHPDGTVSVWEVATGAVPVTLRRHSGSVTSVAFSPDGRRLVTGGGDNTVRVWDAASGAELLTLRAEGAPVLNVRFGPDGRYLASVRRGFPAAGAAPTGRVRLWDGGPPGP